MGRGRALLSVYDKTGITAFAEALVGLGYEVISTGGTLKALQQAGIPAQSVSEVTGFPEILDGRVKTLHPRIHGGLLARRDLPDHMATIAGHGIAPINLLAVNLYPFADTIHAAGVTDDEAIEQIDIGGPAMIRASAKNHAGVLVVTSPADYDRVLEALRAESVGAGLRRSLAAKAFAHTAAYDTLVAEYLRGGDRKFSDEWSVAAQKQADLRYGENPSQRAASYHRSEARRPTVGVLDASQLGGKELSYNNILDADAAWNAIRRLSGPSASIIKHTIPCGLASRCTIADAFSAALEGDRVSAFGGIVALNEPVDRITAARMAEIFFEVILAPGFSDEAIEILGKKKQLRLLQMPLAALDPSPSDSFDIRPIRGGLLVQDVDEQIDDPTTWTTQSKRPATDPEMVDLAFAWEAVRHLKSNAIVLVRDRMVVGVGAGQPNRVESVRIALRTAGDKAKGAVAASDAFFPFADGVEAAVAAGVTAIVQPGGSMRDPEVIAAVDAAGAAMLFTGIRHFRH